MEFELEHRGSQDLHSLTVKSLQIKPFIPSFLAKRRLTEIGVLNKHPSVSAQDRRAENVVPQEMGLFGVFTSVF